MQWRITLLSLLLVSAMKAPPSHAQLSSELFYRQCRADPGDEDACIGYIQGIVAGLTYGKATLLNGQNFCLPPRLSYTQATLVARRFIEQHPEAMNQAIGKDAASMISMALVFAFPCEDRPK